MKPVEILAECLDGSPLTTACDYLFEHDRAWCEETCNSDVAEKECWLRYAEMKCKEDMEDD